MTISAEDIRQRFDALKDMPSDSSPLRLLTRRASGITLKKIDWLWERWLPAGMLTLVGGYGGSGKSTIALSIAAACSVGGILPDGQQAPVLNTLVFAAEDSAEHTIIPRLVAMGADLDRIHVVDGIARNDGEPGWVELRNHAAAIEQTVIEHNIGLVIIDPVSSFVGDANGDRESDVRSGILPLVAMADRTGAAVVMIRHLSKAGDGHRAASRILGSTAWHDVPRAIWMLGDAPDDHQPEPRVDGTRDTRRVLGVVKSNLAAKPVARWCVQPVDGPMYWLSDPAPVTIDECFVPPSSRGDKSRDAEAWLAECLAGGSQPTSRVESAAKDAGITARTLKRARASLNVRARKEPSGQWVIGLPPTLTLMRADGDEIEGGQPEPLKTDLAAFHNKHNNIKSKDANVAALAPFPEPRGNRANGHADDSDHDTIEGGQTVEGGQGGHVHGNGRLPYELDNNYSPDDVYQLSPEDIAEAEELGEEMHSDATRKADVFARLAQLAATPTADARTLAQLLHVLHVYEQGQEAAS